MSSDNSTASDALVSQIIVEDPDLRDIVEEFVGELNDRLCEIRSAYEQLDWDHLTTLAHRLKGAGGSYGYPDISQVCADMEKRFRSHEADEFDTRMSQLQELVNAAIRGLESPA